MDADPGGQKYTDPTDPEHCFKGFNTLENID